jgi:hypothetical protein
MERTDDEGERRLALAMHELEEKQNALPDPDPTGSWNADQDTGIFRMADAHGRTTVEGRFEVLGIYGTQSETWQWAWSNATIDPARCPSLARVRDFGETHGLAALTEPRLICSEDDAVQLAALALHLIEGQAPYRFAASPTARVYLALFDLRKPEAA